MSLPNVSQPLGDPVAILTATRQLSSEALSRARRLAADLGEALPATLTRLGLVSEDDMADAFE